MSTLRLYEIAETYLRALDDLADIEDLPEQAITDTLEGLQGEFEVKAINVAGYIRNIEAEASAVEQARKGMERRQRSPHEYKRTETVTTLLRAEIARALKADEEVPGSHLQRSTRLVIQ
jgi:Gp157 protein